jgi:hypothetical protein
MTASFPNSVKTFTTKTDLITQVTSADVNDLQDEVAAIETLLGVNGLSWIGEGALMNGKIAVSVTSSNLTVAIKTLADANPSTTSPVYVRINGTVRKITAALSVTKNAGTNWCNAGSSELAAKEIDYFVYLGYNATDGVVVGFSRISYATLYSDFSTTTTNEKYAGISTITNAAAGDNYVNIGRFAATLSAGASYTWTVPTFTSANLIQRPINETRWLTWTPTITPGGALTYSVVTTYFSKYKFVGNIMYAEYSCTGTLGGTASTSMAFTAPFNSAQPVATPPLFGMGWASGPQGMCIAFTSAITPTLFQVYRYDLSNFNNSGTATFRFGGFMEI